MSARIIHTDIHQPPELVAGEIHLYVVGINTLYREEAVLSGLLNKEELARAERFINPQHGRKQRCVRGLLRRLLGHYLAVAGQAVQFCYAEHGKPYLTDGQDLRFNLSHSRDMAAYAFCLRGEVGVDIEYMRPQNNLDGMIHHVASPQEQAELLALRDADRFEAFYRLWTRKEAFIKAVGRGLGMGLRAIHIGTQAHHDYMPVQYRAKPMPDWLISDIDPPTNYKLAVCLDYRNPDDVEKHT